MLRFYSGRGHDGFWTQWTVGLSEFVDMPMRTPLQTDCHHDFYKAKYTTQYLEDYVSRLDHAGRTIRDRVVFNIDVQSIKKIEAQWRVECVDLKGDLQTFFTQRLMIASGLTSVQNMPKLPGKEHFGGPIIHSEQFGERGSEIIGSEDVKRITVVGGGKSSADIIYAAVKCGKDVTWLIRNSGTGAPFFASGRGRGPYKNAFEAGHTRMAASMNPSILNNVNGWNTFLHRTGVGTALLKRALASVDNDIRKEANYKGRKSSKGFEKLEYGAP
jgi:dimethylaniline monooxygenase (N-oxide forming)